VPFFEPISNSFQERHDRRRLDSMRGSVNSRVPDVKGIAAVLLGKLWRVYLRSIVDQLLSPDRHWSCCLHCAYT